MSDEPEDFSRFPEDTYSDTSSDDENGPEALPLDEDELALLKEMVAEYKAQKKEYTVLPRRPTFRGDRVNTGIRVNAEIKNRVMELAKVDPDGTGGGSLSGLVEVLLWRFLGCPQDVVHKRSGP